MNLEIFLSPQRFREAAHIGTDRWVQAVLDDRSAEYGEDNGDPSNHIIGAIGECAFAHAIGAPWPTQEGKPDRHAPDVGDWQVRAGRRPGDCLILHDKTDLDDDKFVLVTMWEPQTFRIMGWCYGQEGKNPLHWWEGTKRPAYFVHPGYLRPFDLEQWRLA